MKALIIGGSGGVSGMLASMAKETYEVWALTRGKRPLGAGIIPLCADRDDREGFKKAILGAGVTWDVVFDCICMNERHAEQDLEVLPFVSSRLVVISTDSVYDPARKATPQAEDGFFVEEKGAPEECSYAGNKRKMENVFLRYFSGEGEHRLNVTLFRPGHIYCPGFLLGCYPEHSRQKELPDLILAGQPLSLVTGGIHITQPVFVRDLARTMLDSVNREGAFQQIFCIGGPEAVENRLYYEILGRLLGVEITIRELLLTGYLEAHPEYSGHLCHRIYDLSKLKAAGVRLPDTPLAEGLKLHLESLGYL
jgi:nucleoside-diphosphate-sugar epimerase